MLSPFVFRHTAGRPVRDPRGRLDAIFWLATRPNTGPGGTGQGATGQGAARWADLPEGFGRPDTVSRQFRRWAAAGLWTRLLEALAEPDQPGGAVLRGLHAWICRAYRRAWRLLGVPGVALARRLGFLSALRGPPWMLPDPDLSDTVQRHLAPLFDLARAGRLAAIPRGVFRACGRVLAIAGGRRSIPRSLAPP